MAYTVTQLVTGAFKSSGIVAAEFETVSGDQFQDGLLYLNDLLGEKRVENNMLPYYSEHVFNAVIGQEEYFIENLIQVVTATFDLNSVRYQMNQIQRDQYFGATRANNITSLPFSYHVERQKGGANFYLYFLPDKTYPITLWAQFDLQTVTATQDLELIFDRFYITYLRYALAARICSEFDYDIPSGVQKNLDKYESIISKKSQQLDLRMKKSSTLGSEGNLNYAQVNLGQGWTVPT